MIHKNHRPLGTVIFICKFRFIVLLKITFVGGGAFDAPKRHCKISTKRDGQRPSPTISFDKLLDKPEFAGKVFRDRYVLIWYNAIIISKE